jgi:hypothetical protein
LLSFDNARDDFEKNGWRVFVEKFEGFNLRVAQEFALTFDGCRAKIGDIQLEKILLGKPPVYQLWDKNGSKIQRLKRFPGHCCSPQGGLPAATEVCLSQL